MAHGFPRGRTAIVGAATFGIGGCANVSAVDMAAKAALLALADAGLTLGDVDALYTSAPYEALGGLELAEYLGITPKITDCNRTGGSAFEVYVQQAALALEADDWCWLAIGRQPHHKGFDRAIAALPEFPTARLFIIGIEPSEKSGVGLRKSARRLGVEDRVTLLGFVPDDAVLDTMAAADLLLHPARFDTTGTVILEAIVNGLPVVTTAICGYASHVREAEAGAVVPEPFDRMALSAALTEAADRTRAAVWSANGRQYGERRELYSGLEVAADLILRAADT